MGHVNRYLLLQLSCWFLVFSGWSTAQVGWMAAMNSISNTPSPLNTAGTPAPRADLIEIPAGTHLLMKLMSPLHSTSSVPGSAVYLETSFPVVENSRVVIPERTRVIGVVAEERRPGRVMGRAQMRLKFTQFILPDNRELSVTGNLQSLPGSSANRTTDNEGMIEPVDQIDADVYTVAKTTGAGVLIGSIRRVGIGVGPGALMGAGLGLAKVLFTRGNEISLPAGTRVEMVLQKPLMVQPAVAMTLGGSEASANREGEAGGKLDSCPDRSCSHQGRNNPSSIKRQKTSQRSESAPSCLRDGVTMQCVP